MTPYLLLSAALFSIGAFGVIARRNVLIVLMALELMLNGANIALVAFARMHAAANPDGTSTAAIGQVFVLIVMAVAAGEVAVGLAIVISLWRTRRTVDTNDLQMLNG